MNSKVGGAIALVLLFVYVLLIVIGVQTVDCALAAGCTAHTVDSYNAVMAQYLSSIGGLVSALVIAELAITKPGETPAARLLVQGASERSKTTLKWVTGIYLLVWLLAGVTALLVGMFHPATLPPLTSVGQSWFGLAVAAAYAYLGVKPKAPPGP